MSQRFFAKFILMKELFGKKWFQAVGGVLFVALVYWWVPGEKHPLAPPVAAMVAAMAWLWVLEIIPIAVTSLIPLVLLPALNVADSKVAASYYGKPIIFLFLGGFLLAIGLQKSGLHRRIALNIVRLIGGTPARIVLGFMLASGFLSMWISNTASVMVMMPIALSIIDSAKSQGASKSALGKFAVAVMLGIAYGADIGGMATLIGTPPNLVFLELYHEQFPMAPEISFGDWMMIGIPISTMFVAIGWFVLVRFIFRQEKSDLFGGGMIIRDRLKALGSLRRDEFMAGMVFGFAVLLWVTGSDIKVGEWEAHIGWRRLLGGDFPGLAKFSDSAVAIFASVLLFILPSEDRKKEALLKWSDAKQVPWGILLLFGGGFAIAGGFELSGLSELVQDGFSSLRIGSPILLVGFICLVLTFLTEITSNTAMTTLVLPILSTASVVMEVDPRLILIPATLSASCAFMMPIASPTQAIVFGSGHVSMRQMMRAGIWFNLIGIVLVTLGFVLVGQWLLGIEIGVMPEWAVVN